MTDKAKFETVYDRLPNLEAIAHFGGKTLITSQDYTDLKAYEHALAFTVAKIADQDMLSEVHKAMKQAIDNGTSFADFKKRLKPYLMAKGWLAPSFKNDNVDDDKQAFDVYQSHLGHRLKTIYHTNKSTAYAAGQWQRIQKTKDFLPYLRYMPSMSINQRDGHKAYYGIIRPVDDPIWQSIFPPNGFGCKCWVKQITKSEANRLGITKDSDLDGLDYDSHTHPKTGEKQTVLKGITPIFNHNHDRLTAMIKLAEDKHGGEWAKKLANDVAKLMPKLPKPLLPMIDNVNEALPPPEEWQKVAKIGESIYQKYQEIFDKVDFDKAYDFSKAVLEVMKAEGVEMGGIVNAYGDNVGRVQDILSCYPKSWIDRANKHGSIYVRNMTTRGFHFMVKDEAVAKQLKIHAKNNAELKIFAKFVDDIKVGDSLLKLNNIGKNGIQRLGVDVSIHEFAHRLQSAVPELDDYFKQLWLDRTKGERTRPLAIIQKERGEKPHYHVSEVGRRDNFTNVYVGKNYGTDDNPRPAEVMTMTFEVLLGSGMKKNAIIEISDIKEYWQNDPELLYLGIGLLTRFTP